MGVELVSLNCPKCGASYSEGSYCCAYCGTSIKEVGFDDAEKTAELKRLALELRAAMAKKDTWAIRLDDTNLREKVEELAEKTRLELEEIVKERRGKLASFLEGLKQSGQQGSVLKSVGTQTQRMVDEV